MKVVLLVFVLALAIGCASPAPLPSVTSVPTDAKAPFIPRELNVRISPNDAATFMLNPSPLGKGGYSQGMIVTIDILPNEGWEIEEWIGPVFNIAGRTANIEMVSSQSVAVRMKLATPTGTSTLRPKSTATPKPLVRPTLTPTPVPKLRPLATKVPKPLVRPTPVPTAVPWIPLPTNAPKWTRFFTPTPEASASSYVTKGKEYFNAGNYPMAIEQFTLALQVNPQFEAGTAYYFRGLSYRNSDQYQQAIQDYDKAIEMEPNNGARWKVRGLIYSFLGQSTLADADNAKACSLDSQWC